MKTEAGNPGGKSDMSSRSDSSAPVDPPITVMSGCAM
jgi:hypothetical protein